MGDSKEVNPVDQIKYDRRTEHGINRDVGVYSPVNHQQTL
jgi:hypothetical protein